jgi:hypothetical protein
VLTITSVLDFTGVSPWPLVIGLFVLLTIGFAQKAGYIFGIALSTVTLLAVVAWWYQISHFLPGELHVKTLVFEIICAFVLIIFLGRRSVLRLPRVDSLSYYFPAIALPILVVFIMLGMGVSKSLGYAWSMQNDAVWNIVVSHFVTSDGGVISAIHSNPSPAIPELLSFSSLSGRSSQSVSSLFQHDMTRAAETWLLLALCSSVIAGLIALSIGVIDQTWFRVVIGLVVSALPLAWFSFGYALEFGFYNATLALLLLLIIWLIWQKGSGLPYLTLGALGLALIACLAAWGPLAIVPAGLTILISIKIFWNKIKPTFQVFLFCAVTWLAAVLYGLLVTIPDLRQQSGALGADGGIFEISPIQAAITVALSFLAVVVSMWFMRKHNWIAGFITLLTSADRT